MQCKIKTSKKKKIKTILTAFSRKEKDILEGKDILDILEYI